MYKIVFDTDTSRWTIQLLKYGFLWVPLSEGRKTQSWANYDEAMAYVEQVGLGIVYRNHADTTSAAIWQGGITMPTNAPVLWSQNHPDVVRRR